MTVIMDIWNAVQTLVGAFDVVTAVIAAVVVVAAGFMMHSFSQILNNTLVALIAFAVLSYAYAVIVGGQNAAAHAEASWNQFMAMPMLNLVAYAILFTVGIAIVGFIRSLVLR